MDFGNGEILFGVNDDGTICGIENAEQVCLDIENKINDSISPKPDFDKNQYYPAYIFYRISSP